VSVPTTLSDLERRDARGQFFSGGSTLITFVPFELERPNSAGQHMGEGRTSRELAIPHRRRRFPILGVPFNFCIHPLTQNY